MGLFNWRDARQVADQVLQTGTGKAFPHEPIAVGKRCANAGETKNTMTT